MASNDSFGPSSAHIYGIAIIDGVAAIPEKPRSLLLEAAFWNGDEPLLGLFRYYNANNTSFEPKQRYFVCASVGLPLASSFSHAQ